MVKEQVKDAKSELINMQLKMLDHGLDTAMSILRDISTILYDLLYDLREGLKDE